MPRYYCFWFLFSQAVLPVLLQVVLDLGLVQVRLGSITVLLKVVGVPVRATLYHWEFCIPLKCTFWCRDAGTGEQFSNGQHWKQVRRDAIGQIWSIFSTGIAGYLVHMPFNVFFMSLLCRGLCIVELVISSLVLDQCIEYLLAGTVKSWMQYAKFSSKMWLEKGLYTMCMRKCLVLLGV